MVKDGEPFRSSGEALFGKTAGAPGHCLIVPLTARRVRVALVEAVGEIPAGKVVEVSRHLLNSMVDPMTDPSVDHLFGCSGFC